MPLIRHTLQQVATTPTRHRYVTMFHAHICYAQMFEVFVCDSFWPWDVWGTFGALATLCGFGLSPWYLVTRYAHHLAYVSQLLALGLGTRIVRPSNQ